MISCFGGSIVTDARIDEWNEDYMQSFVSWLFREDYRSLSVFQTFDGKICKTNLGFSLSSVNSDVNIFNEITCESRVIISSLICINLFFAINFVTAFGWIDLFKFVFFWLFLFPFCSLIAPFLQRWISDIYFFLV